MINYKMTYLNPFSLSLSLSLSRSHLSTKIWMQFNSVHDNTRSAFEIDELGCLFSFITHYKSFGGRERGRGVEGLTHHRSPACSWMSLRWCLHGPPECPPPTWTPCRLGSTLRARIPTRGCFGAARPQSGSRSKEKPSVHPVRYDEKSQYSKLVISSVKTSILTIVWKAG